jgi:hypothetical protein
MTMGVERMGASEKAIPDVLQGNQPGNRRSRDMRAGWRERLLGEVITAPRGADQDDRCARENQS